jgi:hypothetical protein
MSEHINSCQSRRVHLMDIVGACQCQVKNFASSPAEAYPTILIYPLRAIRFQ